MVDMTGGVAPKGGLADTQAVMAAEAKETISELTAEKCTANAAMAAENARDITNPKVAQLKAKEKALEKNRIQKAASGKERGEKLGSDKLQERKADDFEKRNPELKAKTLLALRERIKPDSKKEEILEILREMFTDVSLADEALEFVLEVTEGELHQTVKAAKEDFNKEFNKEIVAGKNIRVQAHEAAQKGLGTPTNLRDMYRDLINVQPDFLQLFQDLAQKYSFKELKKIVNFYLHSLGSDMKAAGPSIPPGELHALMTETKNLQHVFSAFRIFQGSIKLLEKMVIRAGHSMPQQLNFETLAKKYISLVGERYITPEKIRNAAIELGFNENEIASLIAVINTFRDAVPQTPPKIFGTVQHRDEFWNAVIECSDDLEDDLATQLEQEEEMKYEYDVSDQNEPGEVT